MSEFWQLFHKFVAAEKTLHTFVRALQTSLGCIKFYAAAWKTMAIGSAS
jgi:hypothetical protein